MKNKLLKIVIVLLCIYFIILLVRSCTTPNVMSQIGKSQVSGLNFVPEIEHYSEWEWWNALETFGALSLDYKERYLREDILSMSLYFQYNSNDVGISVEFILSDKDNATMVLEADYDYEENQMIYNPVYILQGESGDAEKYSDEKSINEYLNKYGLTRRAIKKYQEYAIYNVIVKTWSKTYLELYWLEKWKLKRCEVIDNTFQFGEEYF